MMLTPRTARRHWELKKNDSRKPATIKEALMSPLGSSCSLTNSEVSSICVSAPKNKIEIERPKKAAPIKMDYTDYFRQAPKKKRNNEMSNQEKPEGSTRRRHQQENHQRREIFTMDNDKTIKSFSSMRTKDSNNNRLATVNSPPLQTRESKETNHINHQSLHSIENKKTRSTLSKKSNETIASNHNKAHVKYQNTMVERHGQHSRNVTSGLASKRLGALEAARKSSSKSRQRTKVINTRREHFTKAIKMLDEDPNDLFCLKEKEDYFNINMTTTEAKSISQLTQTALLRWERAVEVTKKALRELVEAEKVLRFSSEYEVAREAIEDNDQWDIGIEKFSDLHKEIEVEYKLSKKEKGNNSKLTLSHLKKTASDRSHDKSLYYSNTDAQHHRIRTCETERIRNTQSIDSGVSCDTELYNDKSRSNSPSEQERQQEVFGNGITSVPPKNYNRSSFPSSSSIPCDLQSPSDFNYKIIKKLGIQFSMLCENWMLNLMQKFASSETKKRIYSREDCYTFLNTLGKMQKWLSAYSLRLSMAENIEDLKAQLRDLVIEWSKKIFYLLPAKKTH